MFTAPAVLMWCAVGLGLPSPESAIPRVRHLQGPLSPGSATPRVPILLGLRSNFGGVSTNSTIPAPTARHVPYSVGLIDGIHARIVIICKVIEPTQYALKRVRFFLFPGSA